MLFFSCAWSWHLRFPPCSSNLGVCLLSAFVAFVIEESLEVGSRGGAVDKSGEGTAFPGGVVDESDNVSVSPGVVEEGEGTR